MRSALAALALSGLSALACASRDDAQCPGNLVAVFHLKGPIAYAPDYAGDPGLAALDPVPELPDCTPSPFISSGPAYPHLVAFDAKLAVDPVTGAAALCRSNGAVYPGVRTGGTHYVVEADAGPAAPCLNSACAATLRVVVAGDVSIAGGAPEGFKGILVEALTEEAGVCSGCLPPVPAANPPVLACAARYALTGTLR